MPYEIITKSENKKQTPDCPICVEKSALLYHTDTKKKYLQLKLVNLSFENLNACAISVEGYNDDGNLLFQLKHGYSELNIGRKQSFGEKDLIVLPTTEVSSCKVRVIQAVYYGICHTYKEIEECEKVSVKKLDEICGQEAERPIAKFLKCKAGNAEMYLPIVLPEGKWQCVCGSLNLSEKCCCCRAKKTDIFSVFDENGDESKAKGVIDVVSEKLAEVAEKKSNNAKKILKVTKKTLYALTAIFTAASIVAGMLTAYCKYKEDHLTDWMTLNENYEDALYTTSRERQAAVNKFILDNKEKLGGDIAYFSDKRLHVKVEDISETVFENKFVGKINGEYLYDLYEYSIDKGQKKLATVTSDELPSPTVHETGEIEINGKYFIQLEYEGFYHIDPRNKKERVTKLVDGEDSCVYCTGIYHTEPGQIIIIQGKVEDKVIILDVNTMTKTWVDKSSLKPAENLPRDVERSGEDDTFVSYASVGDNIIMAENIVGEKKIRVKVIEGSAEELEKIYKVDTVVDSLYIEASMEEDSYKGYFFLEYSREVEAEHKAYVQKAKAIFIKILVAEIIAVLALVACIIIDKRRLIK